MSSPRSMKDYVDQFRRIQPGLERQVLAALDDSNILTTIVSLIRLSDKATSSKDLIQITKLILLLESRALTVSRNTGGIDPETIKGLLSDLYCATGDTLFNAYASKTEAIEWWRKAAEKGNKFARASLIEHDSDNGYDDPEAMLSLAKECMKRNKPAEAMSWLERSTKIDKGKAEEDSPQKRAMIILSCLNSTFDSKKALFWCIEAIKYKSPMGHYLLGMYSSLGLLDKCLPKNKEKAFVEFKKAAEMGLSDGQYSLGLCYLHGDGTTKSIKQAIFWLKRAAGQNYHAAHVQLAHCLKSLDNPADTAKEFKQLLGIEVPAPLPTPTHTPVVVTPPSSASSPTSTTVAPAPSSTSSPTSTTVAPAPSSTSSLSSSSSSASSSLFTRVSESKIPPLWRKKYRNALIDIESDIYTLRRSLDTLEIKETSKKQCNNLKDDLENIENDVNELFDAIDMTTDGRKSEAELNRITGNFEVLKTKINDFLLEAQKKPRPKPKVEKKEPIPAPVYREEKPRLSGLFLLKDSLAQLKTEIDNPKPCSHANDYVEKAYALWSTVGIMMETLRYFRDDPKYFSKFDPRIDKIRNTVYHRMTLFTNLTPERVMDHLDEIKEAEQSAQAIYVCLKSQLNNLENGIPMPKNVLDTAMATSGKLRQVIDDTTSENTVMQKRTSESIISSMSTLDMKDTRTVHMTGLACARMGAGHSSARTRKTCNELRHFLEHGSTPESLPALTEKAFKSFMNQNRGNSAAPAPCAKADRSSSSSPRPS